MDLKRLEELEVLLTDNQKLLDDYRSGENHLLDKRNRYRDEKEKILEKQRLKLEKLEEQKLLQDNFLFLTCKH